MYYSNNYIECKKDWILNGVLMYAKGRKYPIRDHYINADKRIQAYKIGIQDFEGWFWSGSDYFEIDYL